MEALKFAPLFVKTIAGSSDAKVEEIAANDALTVAMICSIFRSDWSVNIFGENPTHNTFEWGRGKSLKTKKFV